MFCTLMKPGAVLDEKKMFFLGGGEKCPLKPRRRRVASAEGRRIEAPKEWGGYGDGSPLPAD